MKTFVKTVYLPHLNYTVRFRRFKKPPDCIDRAVAWIRRDNASGCTVYLPEIATPASVAHELIHALQYICEDRHMDFNREFEHMAYLMQYLMGNAYGYKWKKNR